jgi:hypothetical protein
MFVEDAENRIRLDFGEALDSHMDDICSTEQGDSLKPGVESWLSEEQLKGKVTVEAKNTNRSGEDRRSADDYENPLISSDVTLKKRAEMAQKAGEPEGISVKLERRGNIHHATAQDRKAKQDNRTPEQEAQHQKRRIKAVEVRAKRTPEQRKRTQEKGQKHLSGLTLEAKKRKKHGDRDRYQSKEGQKRRKILEAQGKVRKAQVGKVHYERLKAQETFEDKKRRLELRRLNRKSRVKTPKQRAELKRKIQERENEE